MTDKMNFSSLFLDDPLRFFSMGMARTVGYWSPPNYDYPILHLGPGVKAIANTVDCEWPEYNFDDEDCLRKWESNSVGGVIATHVLEHLQDPRNLITEVSRVLVVGGVFNVLVPHGLSPMYVQDMDHKTPFVLDSFKNLLDNQYYEKGKPSVDLDISFGMNMAVKEGNLAVVMQLLKHGRREQEEVNDRIREMTDQQFGQG